MQRKACILQLITCRPETIFSGTGRIASAVEAFAYRPQVNASIRQVIRFGPEVFASARERIGSAATVKVGLP